MSENPLSASYETRAREAWFRAGISLSGSYTFVASLVVGSATGLAGEILHWRAYEVAISTAIGILLATTGTYGYLSATARQRVLRGGVQVDQF
jgi:hypothetical protein